MNDGFHSKPVFGKYESSHAERVGPMSVGFQRIPACHGLLLLAETKQATSGTHRPSPTHYAPHGETSQHDGTRIQKRGKNSERISHALSSLSETGRHHKLRSSFISSSCSFRYDTKYSENNLASYTGSKMTRLPKQTNRPWTQQKRLIGKSCLRTSRSLRETVLRPPPTCPRSVAYACATAHHI